MTAAAVAALTLYDMCKAVEKGITIGPVRLLEKSRRKKRALDASRDHRKMPLGRALVLTISDTASAGKREDLSGPEAQAHSRGGRIRRRAPSRSCRTNAARSNQRLRRASARGLSVGRDDGRNRAFAARRDAGSDSGRDRREVPGIAELMRLESLKITPRAALSRAVAGIRQSTLIINLPGSVKGVRECLAAVRPILAHAVEILKQSSLGCGE